MKKRCTECGQHKEISMFHKKTGGKYGVRNQCKVCRKQYYAENSDKEKKRVADWSRENPGRNRRRAREYYWKNREEVLKKASAYGKRNRKRMNKYEVERRGRDLNFKLRCYLRAGLGKALKGEMKKSSVMKLIGCSIEFLKKYLAEKFTGGMDWNNYGKWHIDHIKPCASFDMSKHSDQKVCFHYSNLQPLWAHDNISKGARL